MITRQDETGTDDATSSAAARGIVRSRTPFLAPLATGLLVVAAHASTVPMDAWLPVTAESTGTGSAFLTPLSRGALWLVEGHTGLAALLPGLSWPARLAWAPLLLTAAAAMLLSRAFQRLGLPGVAAVLLALVASAGPLLWAQATSPIGAAAGTALAAGLTLMMASRPWLSRAASVALALVGTAVLIGAGPPGAAAVGGVVEELGGIGMGLIALAMVGSLSDRLPVRAVPHAPSPWTLAAAGAGFWALTTPLGAVAQVAVTVPFAWALVASGILTLRAWRGRLPDRRTAAWLVLGLTGWAGVQAFGRPWVARHEMTVLAQQWAHAVASAAVAAPVLTDATPASVLVDAWSRGTPGFAGRVTLARLGEAPPHAPLTLLPGLADVGRWMGLAPASTPAPLATLAEVAAGLPRDVVVAVGLSQAAATHLTPDAWQALATLGSRVGPGGPARARALVGFMGIRAAGSEAAAAPQASLTLLPGDLIGQTGRPSPLDVRIEADADSVRLVERDRLRIAATGIVVAVYQQTGMRLALWSGADGQSLTAGVPGTDGPLVTQVREVLVCRDLPADAAANVTALGVDGALGIRAPVGTRLRVSTTWPDGHPQVAPQVVGAAPDAQTPADDMVLEARAASDAPFGISLRGRPTTVRWQADKAARVCQAPPIPSTAEPPSDVEVHPRVDTSFGAGWHDMEPMGGGRYFRWMSGPRAVLLVALAPSAAGSPEPVTLTLDAQSVGEPGPADRLRLAVNGTWLDARPVPRGRALQAWTLPAALLRPGLNEVLIDTTVTLRPADVQAGADGRVLGLAVYGWRLTHESAVMSSADAVPVPAAP